MGKLSLTGNSATRSRLAVLPAVSAADPLAGAQFSDDFNRSDRNLNGDNGWTVDVINNSMNITSNRAGYNGASAWASNTGSPTPNANHWAAVQVISGTAGNIVAALGRYNNSTNFYMARLARNAGDIWELYKRVSGTYTLLASLSETAPAEPFYIRCYCVGTSIKLQYWNGSTWVDKATATDSAHSTGKPGFFGQIVGSGFVIFDNYGSGTAT